MAQKIKANMGLMEIVMAMSGNNLGAGTLCVVIATSGEVEKINPENKFGGLGLLLYLDGMGIHGEDLYKLNAYVCEGDLIKLTALVHASLSGIGGVTKEAVARAAKEGKNSFDHEAILKAMQKIDPQFAKAAVSA